MRRRLFFGLAVAVLLALFVTLILQPTRATSAGAQSSPTEVHVDNFSFAPAALTVSVHSTVRWVNKDDVPHVVASNDGLFKSRPLDTDDQYSYTFTQAGTYSYYCSLHPKMVGKIIVK